jgi:hypothetical protein
MTTRRSSASSAAVSPVLATPASEDLLSPALAFVVQFRTPAASAPPRFTGRIEHLASGRTARFASVAELVAWLEEALTRRALEQGGER